MKVFLASLFIMSVLSIQAQNRNATFPSEMWHKGEVTLSDGSTLEGTVKYDIEGDIVQLKTENQIQTLGANQIQRVQIYQADAKHYRVFYAIPYRNQYGYRRPKLFELVIEGQTSLLAREMVILTTQRNNDPFFRGGWGFNPYAMNRSTKILEHELYIINSEGKISQLSTNRKDVIYSFDDKHAELRRIIKNQKLKMSRIDDIITLVEEYNKLG